MTSDGNNSEDRKEGAPQRRVQPDPRIRAFVRLLARQAAEHDYARLLETLGKAPKPFSGKE